MKLNRITGVIATSLVLVVAACSGTEPGSVESQNSSSAEATPVAAAQQQRNTTAGKSTKRPAGWAEQTHGNKADPDYQTVFPENKVNQLTIAIAPEDWEAMQANMTQLLGAPGTGNEGGRGRGMFAPPQQDQPAPVGPAPQQGVEPIQPLTEAGVPQQGAKPGGAAPGGPGGGMRGGDMTPENPMWVPATIEFEGKTWTNVGVRYKGNSSLTGSWRSGSPKLGLKLDFDQFEDRFPEIENQRFYGFKQLSLANNFGDATYMRETIAYDLLDEAGLPAANTAFYEVILDYGNGKTSLGIYTMVEVIDDTVVERVFGEDKGNIYEADGPAASLAQGTESQVETSFQKENNEDAADWSDVEALYEALHSELRTTDPAAWRSQLESAFDTDSFLEWLAVSSAIGHWDTYGQMNHNYYLYNAPDSGKLTWISWDHNFVLGAGPGGGAPGGAAPAQVAPPAGAPGAQAAPGPGGNVVRGGMGGRGSVSLDKASVGANWPLIRYLLDDPTYYGKYVDYLKEAQRLLDTVKLETKYQEMATILAPYAAREASQQNFEAAVQSLVQATRDRAKAVSDFLTTQ